MLNLKNIIKATKEGRLLWEERDPGMFYYEVKQPKFLLNYDEEDHNINADDNQGILYDHTLEGEQLISFKEAIASNKQYRASIINNHIEDLLK